MENNAASTNSAGQANPSAQTAPAAQKARERRVGTFTLGVTLVVTGVAMMVSLFFPHLNFELLLKLSPSILIFLGIEVLLSARKGGHIKYDWLGMLLCFFFVCGALFLFSLAWMFLHYPDAVFCW